MKVLLAQPRGMCAGVEMAVAALEHVLADFGAPVYCYHQIAHNAYLIASFEERGVVFVNEMTDVPPGAVVVLSAHGVAPAVRDAAEARGVTLVDATCPLVSKVHAEARRLSRRGYTIVLIGHRGHDETVGVAGEAPEAIVVVETADDVACLTVQDPTRIAYLTQTTLSVTDCERIIEALRDRFPTIEGPPQDDICYATHNRQDAIRALSRTAPVTLVVGSHNSSNSRRLVEVAELEGARAYLIDGPEAIDPAWVRDAPAVALTAGASVPECLVTDTIHWLHTTFGADVEPQPGRSESLHFRLPVEVRRAARSAGAGGPNEDPRTAV
jgi:4-hydroxy-3-methylbut-2-enyl diphosphate reductase